MRNQQNEPLPYHVKGSKTYYQMCRGKKFIFEEVVNPGQLDDDAYVDKDNLMKHLREIAQETMRGELTPVIDKFLHRASIAYIISDLNHNVIGLSISECSFETGNQIILPWLNIYLNAYRQNGIYIICVTKSILFSIKEYQRIYKLKGIKKLIPLFNKWYFVSRTFNPLIYCSMLRGNMAVSPVFNEDGTIQNTNIPADERAVRVDFLKKLGFQDHEIDDKSIFIVKSLHNQEENKQMHETIPQVPDDAVYRFFKNHLGLDQGNLLVSTASFRPAILVTTDLFKKKMKKMKKQLKRLLPVSRHQVLSHTD